MRIIAGEMRSRTILAPKGTDTRPTLDRTRESLFNILQFDIEGRRVLDLFAGTGQLGIECLSRGAASATFVDKDRKAVAIVKDNLKTCGLKGTVVQGDALSFLAEGRRFDLIFIDPPYDSGLYLPVLERINSVDILSDGGIIICETRRETELPEMRAPYRKGREYAYGKVKLCLYTKENET